MFTLKQRQSRESTYADRLVFDYRKELGWNVRNNSKNATITTAQIDLNSDHVIIKESTHDDVVTQGSLYSAKELSVLITNYDEWYIDS